MSENDYVRTLSEKEIKALAESRAEKEAFIKSTIIFALIVLTGFLTLPFIPERHFRFSPYSSISLNILYVIIVFIAASIVGLVTRWLVKEGAYEKYYAFYKDQQRQAPI